MIEAARDDVFRGLVEGLGDRVVALVRPVAGEDLVGSPAQKHVELTGDDLANDPLRAVVHEGHGPASVGKPVRRILLGATGPLHDAVDSDLRDRDDLSHGVSPASWLPAQLTRSGARARSARSAPARSPAPPRTA